MSLKIWEIIEIDKDNEFTYYLTNNKSYQGKIKIANDKVANFEGAVKNGRICESKWSDRVC